jgi:hypothetical protein
MRELDSSSPVSPERWEGGRPQRARHMSAMESGTEMSPCPRGYRRPARDALDAVMMLSSRPGMEVRGSGRFGSSAARRMQPRPLALDRGRRALGWGRNNRTAARHRALSPNNPPARPSPMIHRSSSPIDPVRYRRPLRTEARGRTRRVSAPSCPHHFQFLTLTVHHRSARFPLPIPTSSRHPSSSP